jgi:hypothetical protein
MPSPSHAALVLGPRPGLGRAGPGRQNCGRMHASVPDRIVVAVAVAVTGTLAVTVTVTVPWP